MYTSSFLSTASSVVRFEIEYLFQSAHHLCGIPFEQAFKHVSACTKS
ncbi:MAG: hypothetical protein K0R28_845 [Paenibacillus sp.]|jgi:hypothetical protein|nr:hypothetical protein [Paenibacillus sp.]